MSQSNTPSGSQQPGGQPAGRHEKAPWWNPVKYLDVRRRTPIEQRSYTKIYSVLAIALFLFTLWAVGDEVLSRRPWKDIQADFKDFKSRRINLMIKREKKKLNAADTMKLHKAMKAARKQMESSEYKETLDKIETVDKDIVTAQRDYTFTKSEADEAYYYLDEAKTAKHDTTGYGKTLRKLESKMEAQKAVVDGLQKKRADLVAKTMPVQKELKRLEGVHDSVFAPVIALQRKLEAVEKMPIAVKQTMLVNYEKTNFNNLKMRVDRCVTCHLGYDDPLFKNDTLISTDQEEVKKWKKDNKYNDKEHYKIVQQGPEKDTNIAMVSAVFRTHPNIDMLIKQHKVGEPSGPGVLGCTSCHGGQGGSLVSVEFAHGFEHHWTEPLLTGHYIESSCQNCHSGKMDFEDAKFISMGKKLFTDFGCYGCHNMAGYEGMPTQAPSLQNISAKVTPEWMYQWIKNPRGWSHNTRMPNFMLKDNEIQAVVAFLVDQSKTGKYTAIAKGAMGDPAKGKQTFSDVGCIACHSIDEYSTASRVKEFNSFGPDLNKIGSKVTPEWTFDWIKNPKNYHPQTRMPSMRLSDAEASDITAYLMQHTGENDSVHSGMPSLNLADASLVKQGEKIVRSYGCYGCHTIKGMEGESKVSVALTTFGKKTPGELFYGNVSGHTLEGFRTEFKKAGLPLGELDEEHLHEHQDWYTWTVGKMKNSRMYATERIPQKMPNFQMSTEEAYALSVFLKSATGQYVSPQYADNMSEDIHASLRSGRMFAHWNNCVACHKIEHSGGYISEFIDDPMFLPPTLTPEGSKAQEIWLRGFLRGPSPIRPWLKIRMPTFGFSDSSVEVVSKYFLATHKRPFVLTDYQFAMDQSLLPAGKQLFEQLKCLSCHVVSNGSDGQQQIAPNLQLTKRRLRPDWVTAWLHDPESIQPGTRMPGFWGNHKNGFSSPFKDILGGDVEMQIRAVRDYVYSIGMPEAPNSTPYSVINGTDHYVLPNGQYDVVLTNAMPKMADPSASTMPATMKQPATPAPAKAPAKQSAVFKASKPTAMR